MPKNLFQEIIFTIIMVIVMVYAMICYNIALSTGGMSNFVFLAAFKELAVMGPIAFVLDFFLVGKIAKAKVSKMVDVRKDNPFHLVIAISVVSVIFMCPLMSLAATLLFKDAGSEFFAVWLQTTALNFPMALCWQLFFAGPAVHDLQGSLNLYRVHYDGIHVVGTAGSIPQDTVETISLIEDKKINAGALVSHIMGLDAVIDAVFGLEKPNGSKKVCYCQLSLPLTAISDFAKLGETDPMFKMLDEIVKRNGGVWCKEAEDYLLVNAPKI